MLAIIATVGWILFDVYFCLRTTLDMSNIEWWTFLIGGVGLGVVALVGEILDRKAHKEEISGLNKRLGDLKNGQIYQSGQMNAITQLFGQEAIKKFAEEMRVPITEATREFMANEFMGGVQEAIIKDVGLRNENERLRNENKNLRENPPDKIFIPTATFTPPQPESQRLRAIGAALNLSTRRAGVKLPWTLAKKPNDENK